MESNMEDLSTQLENMFQEMGKLNESVEKETLEKEVLKAECEQKDKELMQQRKEIKKQAKLKEWLAAERKEKAELEAARKQRRVDATAGSVATLESHRQENIKLLAQLEAERKERATLVASMKQEVHLMTQIGRRFSAITQSCASRRLTRE